jgi:hypothetical protein
MANQFNYVKIDDPKGISKMYGPGATIFEVKTSKRITPIEFKNLNLNADQVIDVTKGWDPRVGTRDDQLKFYNRLAGQMPADWTQKIGMAPIKAIVKLAEITPTKADVSKVIRTGVKNIVDIKNQTVKTFKDAAKLLKDGKTFNVKPIKVIKLKPGEYTPGVPKYKAASAYRKSLKK